jgi:hypothetical protein
MTRVTDHLLAVVVVILALYDLAIIAGVGPEVTISRRVLHWSQQYPLLPLAAGILIGHLFCPQTVRSR